MIVAMALGACAMGLLMAIADVCVGVMNEEMWIDITVGVFIGALLGAFICELVGA